MPKPKLVDDEPDATPELPGLVEIAFGGITFVIPRDRDEWSTEALAYLGEGKFNLFVKYTLEIGKPGQWKALVALCPTRKRFQEFFVLFGAATKECVG